MSYPFLPPVLMTVSRGIGPHDNEHEIGQKSL